jgi:hypothetical protein
VLVPFAAKFLAKKRLCTVTESGDSRNIILYDVGFTPSMQRHYRRLIYYLYIICIYILYIYYIYMYIYTYIYI